jgi:hypothetical protein
LNGTTRYVFVPWDRRDLMDAIMDRHHKGPTTTMVVRKLEGTWDGRPEPRAANALGANEEVHRWRKDSGIPASDFLEGSFAPKVAKQIDWDRLTARWSEDDRISADRARTHRLRGGEADLKTRIAAEALRILDGAIDIDTLKELACELRGVYAELGVEEPRGELADDAGLRM